jgi:hypothetical protein
MKIIIFKFLDANKLHQFKIFIKKILRKFLNYRFTHKYHMI